MLSSPRRWTLLAGVGSLGILLLATWIFRGEIASQYHFLRLHWEPLYLARIIDQPDGTNAGAAVLRYLDTDAGKGALIRECMPDALKRLLAEAHGARVYVVWSSDGRTACFSIQHAGKGGVPQVDGATTALPSERIRWIRDRFVTGQQFDVPGYSGAIAEVAGANASGEASIRSGSDPRSLEDLQEAPCPPLEDE